MTHYHSFADRAIFHSFANSRSVVEKGSMSIRFPRRSLLAALLGFGLAAGACAEARVPQDRGSAAADVVTSRTTGVGASLVSPTLTGGLVPTTDIRGRVATQVDPLYRHRPCLLRTAATICRVLSTCDDTGRLLRAGIHNSSLGTPPPLS